jgi:hypothetical protein
VKSLRRHPKRRWLEVVLANLNRIAGDKFPVLQSSFSNTMPSPRDYIHHTEHEVLMKRLFFAGVYRDL